MPNLTRAPRKQPLPGMEDRANLVLDSLAAEYVDLRERRKQLTEEEAGLRARILAELHRQKRQGYKHGGVEIWIVRAADNVKVTVAPVAIDGDELEEEAADADQDAS